MRAGLSRNLSAAARMEGQIIERVRYVRLPGPAFEDDPWDFGGWHWPGVAVEIETVSGDTFYAIWDSNVVTYDLTFAHGSLSEAWHPAQEDVERAPGVWEVTDHPRWRTLVGVPITRAVIAVFAAWPGGSRKAPHAVRLAASEAPEDAVWILAAEPHYGENGEPPAELRPEDVWFDADEVIVVFGDERAERLGIPVEQVLG